MFARQLARLRPAVTRMAVRPRHSLLPAEFRAMDRLMDDFFSTPMLLSRPSVFRRGDLFGLDSRLHLHEDEGKLVAQMCLPEGVKPEGVKIAVKGDILSVSYRFESKRDNFSSVNEFHEELKLNQVDFDRMEALVDTQKGVLRIEAPLRESAPESGSQVKLNIERSDDEKKKIDS